MRIALDAMGGDQGPRPALEGAAAALKAHPELEVVAVGKERNLARLAAALRIEHRDRLHIVDAPDVITMHEAPRDSLKKRQSSLAIAVDLVAKGDCSALVSAGNTGAVHAHTLIRWRKLEGISKPAISAFLPTLGQPTIVIDAGAAVDCKPLHLFQFAVMGHTYATQVLNRRNPRIGLLSIGEEDTKGNELVQATLPLLRASKLNFVGNAEGGDYFSGEFDVIVSDGFSGNTILKCAEGCALFLLKGIKQEANKSILTQLGGLLVKPAIMRLRKQTDYDNYGGAPLLGLNGVCIKCHGRSNAKAYKNALARAMDSVSHRLNEHIIEELKRNPLPPGFLGGGAGGGSADGPDSGGTPAAPGSDDVAPVQKAAPSQRSTAVAESPTAASSHNNQGSLPLAGPPRSEAAFS